MCIRDSFETVTALASDGQELTFTDEAGDDTTISIAELETLTEVTDVLTAGNLIGTYVNEDDVEFDLLESITELSSDGQNLTFTDEAGNDTTISIADLETITEVTDVLTAGNLIGTYVNEDDVEFDLLETVTVLSSDGQSLTFTDEAGMDTTISIAELETATEVVDLLGAGNLIGTYVNEDDVEFDFFETVTALESDGQSLTFTDEAGMDTTISIGELETVTEVVDLLDAGNLIGTFINEDDVEFDLLETVTALESDGQNVVFTDEAGDDTTISIAELETATEVVDLLGAGNLIGTYIAEDGDEFDFFETITALESDGQFILFTDEEGVETSISIAELETITEVTDLLGGGNLIGTYIAEDGDEFEFFETVTMLEADGQNLVFTDEEGVETTISIAELETATEVVDLLDAGNLIGTFINEDEVEFDLLETVTTFTANPDGTFTFTSEDGTETDLDITALETMTEVIDVLGGGHLIGTFVNENDVEFDLHETITELASDGQNLVFTDEEGVETTISIAALESITNVTGLLDAGHLIGTYTNEDDVEFDLLETVTTFTANPDGTFTFTSEDGTETDLDVMALESITNVTGLLDAGHLIGTYTNEDDVEFDLLETVTSLTVEDQEFTFTHEDGSTTTIDISDLETLTTIDQVVTAGHLIGVYENEAGALVNLRETITSLEATGPAQLTFTDEFGDPTVISLPNLESITTLVGVLDNGNLIGTYTNEAGAVINLRETVTTIVDNGDGTYEFNHEDGSTSTIDTNTIETLTAVTNTINGNRIGTYQPESGPPVDIDETITELVANDDGSLTYTDEAGVEHDIQVVADVVETVAVIYEEFYAGGSDDGTTQAWGRNLRMERIANGRWNVVFGSSHPDGTDYAANILTQEGLAQSDSVLAWIIEGTKTEDGFTIQLATGDNGGTPDVGVNNAFTVSVNAPRRVLIENP